MSLCLSLDTGTDNKLVMENCEYTAKYSPLREMQLSKQNTTFVFYNKEVCSISIVYSHHKSYIVDNALLICPLSLSAISQ